MKVKFQNVGQIKSAREIFYENCKLVFNVYKRERKKQVSERTHASQTEINLYFTGMKNFYNLIASLLKMKE